MEGMIDKQMQQCKYITARSSVTFSQNKSNMSAADLPAQKSNNFSRSFFKINMYLLWLSEHALRWELSADLLTKISNAER